MRELQHSIERAVILCNGNDLEIRDFQISYSYDQSQPLQFDHLDLDRIEKWAIETCLGKHDGHVTRAASELGITRGAFYRRIEKYEIKKY